MGPSPPPTKPGQTNAHCLKELLVQSLLVLRCTLGLGWGGGEPSQRVVWQVLWVRRGLLRSWGVSLPLKGPWLACCEVPQTRLPSKTVAKGES